MWMGLIFYLGNEFGRIDREWMVVFTVGIIGMNVLYSAVVMFIFMKEYILEKIEAKKVQEHEKMVHKLAAHMYQQQQIEASMSPGSGAGSRFKIIKNKESFHSLDPRRVGRNSLGGDVLREQLAAATSALLTEGFAEVGVALEETRDVTRRVQREVGVLLAKSDRALLRLNTVTEDRLRVLISSTCKGVSPVKWTFR